MTRRALAGVGLLSLGALGLLALLVFGFHPDVTDAAVDRLERMLSAEKTLAYEGMKEWDHLTSKGEYRQHLFVRHYPEAPTLVTRTGGTRGRPWVQWRNRFDWLLGDRDLLLENYLVHEEGRTVVIERKCTVLEVRSRYPGRPSLRLILDDETGLALSSEFRDHAGKVYMRSRFTTLLLDPELPEAPERRKGPWGWGGLKGGWGGRKGERPVRQLSFTPLRPSYLPEGFRLKSSRVSFRGGLHEVYGDGLSRVELYQKMASEPGEECVVRQRRRGSRVKMHVVVDGIELSLEGKLAPALLVKMLESLEKNPEDPN